MLRCPFCEQPVDGLTLYLTGAFRLFICERCYGRVVAMEHQPHSKLMHRLRRLVGQLETEVMSHEGVERLCSEWAMAQRYPSTNGRKSP